MIKSGELGDPLSLLREPLSSPEINEFLAEHYNDSDDEKAFQAHLFIKYRLRIKYLADSIAWNKTEYWQTPQITINRGTGDCEDQTLLWMKLMQLLNVPSYKCMALGGYVFNEDIGEVEGHCYPVYFTGTRAVNMDLTYYIRILRIKDRATFRIPNKNYLSFWWAFNWRSCYLKPYWVKK